MSDKNRENRHCLSTTQLTEQMEFLEKTLREKERVERELRDSEKRYRRLFESAKDGPRGTRR